MATRQQPERRAKAKRARELEANLGNRNIGHLLFLVQNYRPEYYWFEIAESARRLILGVLVGLLSSESPTTGPTIAFLVSIGMIYVYLIWGPGPSPDDNRIEAVMSYSLALLFTSALLIMAATSASDDENSAAAPEDGGNAEDGDAASSAGRAASSLALAADTTTIRRRRRSRPTAPGWWSATRPTGSWTYSTYWPRGLNMRVRWR